MVNTSWSVLRINRGGGLQLLKKIALQKKYKTKEQAKQAYKFQLSLPWSLKQVFLNMIKTMQRKRGLLGN